MFLKTHKYTLCVFALMLKKHKNDAPTPICLVLSASQGFLGVPPYMGVKGRF